MASGVKTVLLSESGEEMYTTVVADTSSALTFDLMSMEFVIIDPDVAPSDTFISRLALLGVG